jgi:G:T-mismatch repair DNA endonuclease (very short patch repair protein)
MEPQAVPERFSPRARTRFWTNEISPQVHRFVSFYKAIKRKGLRVFTTLARKLNHCLWQGILRSRLRTEECKTFKGFLAITKD